MQKIAVLTSGGDSPGMNAAIRAVVRMGIYKKVEVIGVRQGYQGLLNRAFLSMNKGSVADIIQRGGTILQTARCDEFFQKERRIAAINNLKSVGVGGLVVIGGGGSLQGAELLEKEGDLPIIGIPATIDNDIGGTDYSIGFDTAMNTVIDAVNKVRDTATSHERIFVVEVMGRECGFLALYAGLASGAESIVIPEYPTTLKEICHKLDLGFKRGKKHSIIMVTEGVDNDYQVKGGAKQGRAFGLGEAIREATGHDTRVIILGHLQRGGSPSGRDRILASRLGAEAVKLLCEGKSGLMVGIEHEKIRLTPITEALRIVPQMEEDIFKLAHILSL